jgi:hypothetical protein
MTNFWEKNCKTIAAVANRKTVKILFGFYFSSKFCLNEKRNIFKIKKEKCNNDNEKNENGRKSKSKGAPKFIPESEIKEEESWKGYAMNTGPKGVIKDWQRFKQLENEKNKEAEVEKKNLIKKLAITCKSADLDEHLEKENLGKNQITMEELEKDLMEDAFFQEYVKKKFMEMNRKLIDL